jgi:hypothetical protein
MAILAFRSLVQMPSRLKASRLPSGDMFGSSPRPPQFGFANRADLLSFAVIPDQLILAFPVPLKDQNPGRRKQRV